MKSAQDKAYATIKEWIINLDIKPGERLRAQMLAEQLQISRTPIRETLSRLEQEGLVDRTGGWGYVVRSISLKEILDLFRVRQSLEVQAALEALLHVDKELLTSLDRALKDAKLALQARKFSNFRLANQRFRLRIAEAAQNTLLHRILIMINDRIRLVGGLHLNVRAERAGEALSENLVILKCIRKRDAVALEAAVLDHIQKSQEDMLQNVVGATLTCLKN